LNFSRTLLFLFVTLFLSGACVREDEIALIEEPREDDPLMTATSIDVLFSDSGKIQAHLTSPLLKKYTGEDPCTEFPDGFHAVIFDSIGRAATSITGNYGKNRDAARIMEARGNVVVRNLIKHKQMETEHLTWDQNRHLIFSQGKVKITEPSKILFGDGIQANESFSWYKIINPTGQMMVKKDSV
jgi:LPS export ABC transporter protein LptC